MRDTRRRLGIPGLAVLLASALVLGPTPSPAGASPELRDKMFAATNRSRVSRDRDALKLNLAMSKLARQHSLAMAEEGALFHTDDPVDAYLDGVKWSTWGENVGMTTGTVKDVQSAFMKSKGHRRNILRAAFERVAVGAVRRDGYLWVTVFFYG
jgi:uncharacterized protein YkwD